MVRVAATELMPDFTGRFIDNGRYKLLESLGAGAYGKVYRAIDTLSSPMDPTYFAIKCLNRHPAGSHHDELQQKEFALHKVVSGHPNIVTFYRWFRDESFVYVVLDLCLGGDLFTAITEKKTFYKNTPLIKKAFIQILDGLQHSHDLGVFHRDIKPENVLCIGDGSVVKIADFGLSSRQSVCEDYGCGSSYYMSPECIGKEVTMGRYSTRHTDIWAMGVILTNMITGRNPWRYATSRDECFAAFLCDQDFLRQVLPISEGVNDILKRIFHLNPLCRITLPDLREKILALDDLYASDEDFAILSNRANAESTREESLVSIPCHSDRSSDKHKGDNQSRTSFDSDEHYTFASPVDDHHSQVPTLPNFQDIVHSPEHFVVGEYSPPNSPTLLSSSDTSGSGPESKGPITPATHATEPDIEVPDLGEGDNIGEVSLSFPSSFISKFRTSTPKAKGPVSRSTHIFRTAVQRIKGLSSGSASP